MCAARAIRGVWLAALLASAALHTSVAHAAPALLTTAQQVRALLPGDADRGLPVELRGVVTFVAGGGAFLFVDDGTDGIFVDAARATAAARGARVGDTAIVQGTSSAGLYAPQVQLRHLTVVGPGVLPAVRRASHAEVASGKLDSRLVSLEGTVRAVEREPARADGQVRLVFRMGDAGGTFQVRVALADARRAAELEGGRLVDATVAIRGVCGGVFNGQRQLVGIVLHAPDADGVTVLEPPAAVDPFARPPEAIKSLFRFSPGAMPGRGARRVRVDGTVALHRPGEVLYLWDGESGLSVQAAAGPALQPGDRVEVVGFPGMGDWTPVLEDAVYQRTGGGPPPPPLPTTAEREASEESHDARLVTLPAELLETVDRGGRVSLALHSGDVFFQADLGVPAGGAAVRVERGSRLELTGISVARVDRLLKRPIGFRLVLRAPSDLVVRGRPNWWTLERLLGLVAALGATFILAAGWVVILRRRVREQTEVIRAQLQHEAALEERYRDLFENANDVVFSQDADGRLLAINRAAEELTGFRRAELLAGTLYDLMPEGEREPARRLFAGLLSGREAPPTFETAIVARDGRVIPLEMTVRPTARAGRPSGAEGIARDVSARKRAEAELAAANQRLLDVSRRAGMAEVASSVLHNVGNVLNSVNVSAAVLADRLRASRADNVGRAAAMLREHERAGDLAAFLGEDPQGKALVEYLGSVAEHLGAERKALLGEVETLTASVDHIKEIVVMQQGYARVAGGVQETLAASVLLGDALRMHAESSAASSSGVELQREIAADPRITVEKHKVLQILVNLVANARNACAAGGCITLRVEAAGRTRVRFVVSDNGVGIAADDLTRIFHHGFTTRKEGHGFGLHSAALTARELGGSLTVSSDGPGRGATFTLELPIDPAHGDKHTTKERLKIVRG